jgi:hypothetical protein
VRYSTEFPSWEGEGQRWVNIRKKEKEIDNNSPFEGGRGM